MRERERAKEREQMRERASERGGYVLLYLVAAVGACEVYDELEFAAGVVHVLPLECSLLGFVSPCHPLVHVQQSVDSSSHCDDAPACSLSHLHKQQKSEI